MSFSINIIVTPIVCFLGLVGNVLGVGVLWTDSRRQKLSVYEYLCALTICDALYLFFGLLRSIPHVVQIHDTYRANYIEEHMKIYTIYIDIILTYTSTHLVIVMAVERFIALVKPFKVKDLLFTKYPRLTILSILALNMVIFLPFPISFEVSSFKNNDNATEYFLRFKPRLQDVMNQYMFVQTILYNYIPATIFLIVNIGIPVAYARVIRNRKTDLQMCSSHNSRQMKITLMVLCITTMYLLFSLTDLFVKTLGFVDNAYSIGGQFDIVFWFFTDFTNLFMYLNAANDFIIYILVSNHYRKIFSSMYCRCSFQQRDLTTSSCPQEIEPVDLTIQRRTDTF